ncbi:hypothetical protein P280DRAFT_474842 [Massarina eburnea CBS 473.64]|uniref:Uncharacterized protein n=1 Tax=Massarina eburnea CBS 473.64 TaxID=1395130 RepID=A0A6A6RJ57_9PLEO|nr:hypothetical protein P280DRAFT_474842 [Massarina eburnea CBS 473.64]
MSSSLDPESAFRADRHPFRDLRSAAHEKKRIKKHLGRYKSFQATHRSDLPSHPQHREHIPESSIYEGFPRESSTLHSRRFTKREAYEAQRGVPPFRHHHSREERWCPRWERGVLERQAAHREVREFSREEEMCWDYPYWICCSYCQGYWPGLEQDNREHEEITAAVNSWEEWTEVGETFSKWCQRRIGEMRAVKEERLRAKSISTPELNEDEGYHSSTPSTSINRIPTTTRATHPSDIEAEALIKQVLTPNARLRRHAPWIKLPRIIGFYWFGEYEWYWHRNESGCWELSEYNCQNAEGGSCEGCKGETRWGGWDPEAKCQAWWLHACIADEVWEEIEGIDREWEMKREEEYSKKGGEEMDVDVEDEEDENEEWDVLSTTSASSEWTQIDM